MRDERLLRESLESLWMETGLGCSFLEPMGTRYWIVQEKARSAGSGWNPVANGDQLSSVH